MPCSQVVDIELAASTFLDEDEGHAKRAGQQDRLNQGNRVGNGEPGEIEFDRRRALLSRVDYGVKYLPVAMEFVEVIDGQAERHSED